MAFYSYLSGRAMVGISKTVFNKYVEIFCMVTVQVQLGFVMFCSMLHAQQSFNLTKV